MLIEKHHGQSWSLALISGISLLIAVMPEEFPIVYSLYLSLGAWQLSKEHALVRDLPGVETLGSVTVICTDKTGTLTTGQLALDAIHSQTHSVDELVRQAVLACEQTPFDPIDQAILRFAHARGVESTAHNQQKLLREYPFDSTLKRVTRVCPHPDGRIEVVSKGSFEGLVALNQLSPSDKENYLRVHNEFASQGMRVLAVASGEVARDYFEADVSSETSRATDESHLTLCGLIAFRDPPREHVPASLEQCRQAGIRIIMITGDHADTAQAIAASIGLTHSDGSPAHVRQGSDLDEVTDEQRDFLIHDTDVLARTQPSQKHYLVESLRRQGEIVAMTGDGVNDAPALRVAHIGVAMGKRGTEVAREAATVVLLDDDFSTIVSATRNGRRIYDNLAMAFAYLIAIHVPLALVGLVIPLMGLPLLLLPIQLIVLEIVVHPIVALVFESQPAARDVMTRPPRSSNYALTWATLKRPFWMGIRLSLAVIVSYWFTYRWGWTAVQARGMGFATLLLVQPFLIAVVSKQPSSVKGSRPRFTKQFTISYLVIILVTVLTMYWPAFGQMLNVSTFPSQGWLCIALTLLATVTGNYRYTSFR